MSRNLSSIPSLTDTEKFVLPLICWATVSNAAELFVGIYPYIVMCILEEIASQKQRAGLEVCAVVVLIDITRSFYQKILTVKGCAGNVWSTGKSGINQEKSRGVKSS